MRLPILSRDRVVSIDAFRGITIFVMIFVNELAGIRDIPAWMKHMPRDADAMSFVDLVFPAFLFIVGMSIPFAINNRLQKDPRPFRLQQHILFRAAGLLVLGFFMVNAEGNYDEKAMGMPISLWSLLFFIAVILIWKVYRTGNKTIVYILRAIGVALLIFLAFVYRSKNGGYISPHWWGILGLIGWAYLFSCLFYQVLRANRYLLLLAVALCVAIYCLNKLPVQDHPLWMHYINDIDRAAAHTSITLCGVILSLLMFNRPPTVHISRKFVESLIFGVLLFVTGFLFRPIFKISKVYATPSWCMYSAAACVIIFIFLYWLIDLKKWRRGFTFFQPAATQPLLTYILPDIVYYITALAGIHLFPHRLSYGWPGTLWSLCFSIAIMGLAVLLSRAKLKLQL